MDFQTTSMGVSNGGQLPEDFEGFQKPRTIHIDLYGKLSSSQLFLLPSIGRYFFILHFFLVPFVEF